MRTKKVGIVILMNTKLPKMYLNIKGEQFVKEKKNFKMKNELKYLYAFEEISIKNEEDMNDNKV